VTGPDAQRFERHEAVGLHRSGVLELPSGHHSRQRLRPNERMLWPHNMASFLGSLLVVVGKGLKLSSDQPVSHGLAARSKVCAVLRYACLVVRSGTS